ncbi:DUF1850 domain-containing protein [Halalkalibacter alkalisediminis]|uniref:DUF1850 domain-containing protein n=1 Tax=Halalkalibacter alkalisediminis TaxID=935616 RepID=A0ABV6NH12_9BACI|nr:DUF1850 domain-containing protein [Halalkalibacter alkalisediminis]
MKTNKKISKKALLLSTAFLFLFIGSVVLLFNPSQGDKYFLQIYLPYEDVVFFETPIKPDQTFYHEYVHSVELSPVREYFKIDERYNMIATESWTQSFGAGLPYEKKDEFEMRDGFFVITQERLIEHLNLLPSHLFPHAFYVGEERVDLSGELNGKRIRIQVIKK